MTSPNHTVIGKFYAVPCVLNRLARDRWNFINLTWVPILGPLHEDAEIVKFDPEHWHIDWRFVPERIIQQRLAKKFQPPDARSLVGLPINLTNTSSPPTLRRLKCRRHLPEFPCVKVQWLQELEAAFANRRMENMICPHKGMPLHDCPVVDGAAVCMGHGLRWNIKTGRLHKTQPASPSPPHTPSPGVHSSGASETPSATTAERPTP